MKKADSAISYLASCLLISSFVLFNLVTLSAQDQPLFTSDVKLSSETPTIAKSLCGTPPKTSDQRRYTLDVVDKAGASRNAGTTCIPIRVNIVTLNDGSGGISMEDINIGLSYLNYFYLEAGIEFYICGTNTINSTTWYDFDDTEEAALTAGASTDAINMYFVNSIDVSGFTACGYAYYPFNNAQSLTVMMRNNCTANAENGTMVHEIGHFFDLAHTHDNTENGNTDPLAENVPRSGGNANCTTHGDMLCDTEADPNGSNDGSCNFVNDGTSTQDINGVTYTPDLDNIMSYYSDYCGGIFTAEQYTRIMNGLTERLAHTNYDLDGCSPMTVTDPSGLSASLNGSYGVDLSWTDNAGNETGYLIERSSDGGTTWAAVSGGAVGPDVTTYTDNTISANTTYDYRVKASNDDCNDYNNTATIAVGLVYCVPTHQGNSCTLGGSIGVAIYNFLLEETSGNDLILNTENGCTGALSVFSNTYSANVTAGNTYDFTANFQLGNPPSGSGYSQYITIWVDLDQNGDFEDAGEMLYQASSAVFPTVSNSITIPASASNGTTTLRIRSGWSTGGAVSSPCDYHALSEAEDYKLIVAGGLPVELISFDGRKENETVTLNWSTSSEENNDYFIVERSSNGIDFDYLGTQKGAGTSATTQHYQFVDRQPLHGINYYRLTQVDFDDTRHIEGDLVAVEFIKGAMVSVVPNPVRNDVVTINYLTEMSGECQISAFDLNGRLLYQQEFEASKGANQYQLNLPDLPNGVYLLKTGADSDLQTLRFVKARY